MRRSTDIHPPFETLSDLADGLLSATARETAEAHVAACARCAGELARLARLLARAADVSREIKPAADLWPEVRARIAAGMSAASESSAAVGASREAEQRPGRRNVFGRREAGWLAAAAVLLVVISSTITWRVARHGTPTGAASVATRERPARPAVPVLEVERGYRPAVDELERALAGSRLTLDPRTLAVVTRSLRTIDSAIVEAREALGRDPRDVALTDLLAASYERKLELLRRAVSISSQS